MKANDLRYICNFLLTSNNKNTIINSCLNLPFYNNNNYNYHHHHHYYYYYYSKNQIMRQLCEITCMKNIRNDSIAKRSANAKIAKSTLDK